MSKTIAQQHYEADCAVHPDYHDGTPRKAWGELGALEQSTWNGGNYRIFLSDFAVKRLVATVQSLETAKAFLASWGEVISFELDSDNPGFADCALLRSRGSLEIYTIEPV